MGKTDDDDGDEKGAYSSNALSAGESKGGDDADDLLSPVVKAFCHHVVGTKFRKELDTFFSGHCGDFEDASLDAEQRLEWTMIFEKYIAMVETMLETFCGIHQLAAEGVFKMVQRAVQSGMLDDEFMPSILTVTDYAFFIEQMGLMATEEAFVRKAARLAQEAGGEAKGESENISGIWRVATKDGSVQLTDTKDSLDRYLRAVGVPKSLHGLFKGSLFSTKGLVVTQDGDELAFVSDTITGRHKQSFVSDGRSRAVSNMSGTKTPYTCSVDQVGRVVVRNEKPSGLPRGSALVSTWQLLGKHLKCTCEVETPDGVVMHEFFYRRNAVKTTQKPAATAAKHK